jgi:SAM-dependent methyltransferase
MGYYREAFYYDDVYERYEKYSCHYTKSRYYELWKRCVELIPDDANILEVGCGTGQFLQMLQDTKRYLKGYAGFDFSHVAISMCKSGLVRQGDARNPNLYGDSYDLIIALEVMEHLLDDVEVIRLWPKGKNVLLTLPVFDDPAHVRFFETAEQIIKRYEHDFYCLNIKSVEQFDRWFIVNAVTI